MRSIARTSITTGVSTGFEKMGFLLAFAGCWYFYFASTFTLRVLPGLMWPLFAFLGIVLIFASGKRLHSETLAYSASVVMLMVISFANSGDIAKAETTLSSYLIYYYAALGGACLLARRPAAVAGLVKGFALFHAAVVFVQVFAPALYSSAFLPMLPEMYQADIEYQMVFNHFYYGFTVQSSMCAMYISFGIVSYLVDILYGQDKTKTSFVFILFVLFVALFYTSRRGSVIALACVALWLLWQRSGKRGRNIVFALGALLVVMVIGADNIPGLSGLLDKNDSVSASKGISNGRFGLWAAALQAWDVAPFFGRGVGSLSSFTGTPTVDNAYVTALLEHGLIGSIIFWAPYVFFLVKTLGLRRDLVQIGANARCACALTFSLSIQITYLVMGVFESYFNEPLSMFIYFLVVCSGFATGHLALTENSNTSPSGVRGHDENGPKGVRG